MAEWNRDVSAGWWPWDMQTPGLGWWWCLLRLVGLELSSQWRMLCVVQAYGRDPSAHCSILFLFSLLFVWICVCVIVHTQRVCMNECL